MGLRKSNYGFSVFLLQEAFLDCCSPPLVVKSLMLLMKVHIYMLPSHADTRVRMNTFYGARTWAEGQGRKQKFKASMCC